VGATIHSEEYRALLSLLREARLKTGLSQAQLATRLGRPQSYISKVEIGERRIDVEEVRQICTALDLDMVKVVRTWLRHV
jgi:transcriptional regulator with XRE-family HTH domain